MKILQIIQRSQLRGAEIFACQLAEELKKKGHEVDVLVLFGKPDNTLLYDLSFTFLQANEKKRWSDFLGYKNLSKLIISGGYDIVQANAGDTLKYAALSKKIHHWKPKLIFRNANKISDFLKSTLKLLVNKWLLKEVDFIASVSQECKKDFLQLFPFFKNRIEVLPIGVSLSPDIHSFIENSNEIKKDEGPVLLHIGGFVPEKNHIGLIRIFSTVLQIYPDARLYLVGEGKMKSTIESLVADLGLGNHVFFLGRRKDIPVLIQQADMLLLPSLIEGLPGVILEAFSLKKPVVAYNVGGVNEILINNNTGWLISKGDEKSFVAAIQNILTLEIDSIVQNAYLLCKNEYEISEVALRFSMSYKKLLAN